MIAYIHMKVKNEKLPEMSGKKREIREREAFS